MIQRIPVVLSALPRYAGAKGFQQRRLVSFFARLRQEHEQRQRESLLRSRIQNNPGLDVLIYPHPQLRAHNAEVTSFSDELREKAEQLLITMYAQDGIGLAAPQVGMNERIMVFNETGEPEDIDTEMVLCNPHVVSQSKETLIEEESCLSFPRIHGKVERAHSIVVEYQNLHGERLEAHLEGLPARIFLHEYDHLDGKLFIDHFDEKDKAKNKKRIQRYITNCKDAAP